ncbi:hypothetical protein V6Z11_A10G030700 [Gossypium hirsutum]
MALLIITRNTTIGNRWRKTMKKKYKRTETALNRRRRQRQYHGVLSVRQKNNTKTEKTHKIL